MEDYGKAYNAWDKMAPNERKSWCIRNEENCTDIEYGQQLREAGYDEKTIAHLVLDVVK